MSFASNYTCLFYPSFYVLHGAVLNSNISMNILLLVNVLMLDCCFNLTVVRQLSLTSSLDFTMDTNSIVKKTGLNNDDKSLKDDDDSAQNHNIFEI